MCPDTDCLSNALKKGALTRALEIPLPATFTANVIPAATPQTTEGGARGQE